MSSEPLLSSTQATSEVDYVNRQLNSLSKLQVLFPPTYVDENAKRGRLVNIPLCEPPKKKQASEGTPDHAPINLTVKSLKPPLSYSILASPTSSIVQLKSQLVEENQDGKLNIDGMKWIYKGKAMSDGKLLMEFAVPEGGVVNMMIKAIPAPIAPPIRIDTSAITPTTTNDPESIPIVSISTPDSETASPILGHSTRPSLSITTSTSIFTPTPSQPTHPISNPELWETAWESILRNPSVNGDERIGREIWECWLSGSRGLLSASEKALIRERVGISAMGGI